MASEYVVFLERPVVGSGVSLVKNGQRLTSSPVMSVRPDAVNPALLIVQTASGSTYTGQVQPDYQPTMYAGQAGGPAYPTQSLAACPRCGGGVPPGAYACPHCGSQFGPGSYGVGNADNERMWAMLCHIGTFVLGFVAPLVLLLVMGSNSRLVDHHARQSLNFSITMTIAGFVGGLLCFVLIGLPLLILLGAWATVATIIAGVKAYSGEYWVYPATLQLL